MSDRTFTLPEAEALLPVLETLMHTALEARHTMEAVEAEMQKLHHRVFLAGGSMVDVMAVARRKAEGEKAAQRATDAVAEITAAGVQVKSIESGLLDFPCRVNDRTILLCWRVGEKAITYWHGTDEGFAGRKPIDERIAGKPKEKKKDKPN